MSNFDIIHLDQLMKKTTGSPNIVIGLIDGPILINHPDLNTENIIGIPGEPSGVCSKAESVACSHGTFIAGILKANRSSNAPAICPDCTLLVRPIFFEHITTEEFIPSTNPKKLAIAIIDCINAGARIINLSLALANPSVKSEYELDDAFNYASKHGVIIIAAAGNQGILGSTAITRHPWVIPVVACNNAGNPMRLSNLGSSIGRKGVSAPGESITSLGTNNSPVIFSGTSAAAVYTAPW